MRPFNKTSKIALGYITAALSCSAFSATVTPSSLSIAAGSSQTVQISNVAGSVSVKSSKAGIAAVRAMDSTTYRVDGLKAGSLVLEFKDKKSTAKVYIS